MPKPTVFRSELQPMAPDLYQSLGSSSSSRQRDLVFVVNPLGLLLFTLTYCLAAEKISKGKKEKRRKFLFVLVFELK